MFSRLNCNDFCLKGEAVDAVMQQFARGAPLVLMVLMMLIVMTGCYGKVLHEGCGIID